VRVSLDGGPEPVWAPDGRRIYFQNPPKMMAAAITVTGQEVRAETPKELFSGGFSVWQPNAGRTYDVQKDGRLLIIETTDQKLPNPSITVVENWFEELKQKVPVK
jgi:hypothetical protein